MDIYRALGVFIGAMFIPLVILVIYKAVPKFRTLDPIGWYVVALVIAVLLTLVATTPLPEKILALLLCMGTLLFSMARDIKMHRTSK